MRKIIISVAVIIVIVAALIIKNNKATKELETTIKELNMEIGRLQVKGYIYTELIKLYEELEENLQNQVNLLESENGELRTIRAKLTAYSPLDNVDGRQAEGNPNKTSRGKTVGRTYAAADPKKLPYGTILEIPNYGIVEIQDTGGALRNDNNNIRIDLYHDTFKEALQFGIHDSDVKILKWGE